jgi:hypothetical protein
MGLLDKAKNAIANNFGEETVKAVNYDKEKDTTQPSPKKEKAPKAPKPPKVKTPKPEKQKPIKAPAQSPAKPITAPTPEKVVEKPIEPHAFDIPEFEETEDIFEAEKRKREAELEEKYHDVPDVSPRNSEIKDVLDFLGISPTFEIERNIFLPEDLQGITFDLQTPFGFEQSQVTVFLENVKTTVERYVALLRQRNEDVAKLASVIDRLQVDINNQKYQNEISHGINVMPTSDDSDLESKYTEARLKIRRLEDTINEYSKNGELTNTERKKYETLQDEFSLQVRENEGLKEEIYNLKNRLALLEENDTNDAVSTIGGNEPDPENEDFSLQQLDTVSDEPLPAVLPGLTTVSPAQSPAQNLTNSAFAQDETSVVFPSDNDNSPAEMESMITYSSDDDEDAILDSMMRDWNKD